MPHQSLLLVFVIIIVVIATPHDHHTALLSIALQHGLSPSNATMISMMQDPDVNWRAKLPPNRNYHDPIRAVCQWRNICVNTTTITFITNTTDPIFTLVQSPYSSNLRACKLSPGQPSRVCACAPENQRSYAMISMEEAALSNLHLIHDHSAFIVNLWPGFNQFGLMLLHIRT